MRTVRTHRFLFPILLLTFSLLLSSCALSIPKEETQTEAVDSVPTLTFDGRRYRYSGNASDIAVEGDSLTIQRAGVYRLSGTLSDGVLRVDVSRGETVHLILDGVSISSSRAIPLEIRSAACVILELADGSVNTISDFATETGILSVLNALAFVWVGLLLFFGMMVTHDYSIGKNVLTTLGTILGMVCIMFIAILFSTLLGKLVSFVTNIVTEIQYRM